MLGLLQAYGSDESDSDDDEEGTEELADDQPTTSRKLPKPFELNASPLDTSSSSVADRSVFANPYVRADEAKKALLEKHVKMISTDVRAVNGKKICWNYRKRKCRFGHNCKYAHDSDLQTSEGSAVTENNFRQAPLPESYEIIDEATLRNQGKKRPGLSQTIIPSGKVMKKYFDQKAVKY